MIIKKYIQFVREQITILEERRSDRMLGKSKTYSLDEVVSS